MNQENRESSLLLKSVAAMQIVVMIIFAGSHLWLMLLYAAHREAIKEYEKNVRESRAVEAENQYQMAAHIEQLNKNQTRYENELDEWFEHLDALREQETANQEEFEKERDEYVEQMTSYLERFATILEKYEAK